MSNEVSTNPYEELHTNISYHSNIQSSSTNSLMVNTFSCKKCKPLFSFLKNHCYIYIIFGLLFGIFVTNIYNSYVFNVLLSSIHNKSKLDTFFNYLFKDYQYIETFLLQNNITFQMLVDKVNNSLGLFKNMSHNSYLACTSDLLIPTIDHEKCYQT